jgi:hypothetical protein
MTNTNVMPIKGNKFQHHSGGVVQVQHVARFGAVPEALLEDQRLDLDTRAVAAWLAIKHSGWQINIGVLRHRLSRNGKILGKDRWTRIAEELEAAQYLSRKKINGPGGLWIWHITFTPVPGLTIGGFSADGPAATGWAADGTAVSGKPGNKVLPRKKQTTKNKTTTNNSHAQPPSELKYPKAAPNEILDIQELILECDVHARQEILDELEGYRQSGEIRSGIVGLAKTLIRKAKDGKFSLNKGHTVQAERARRLQNAAALAQAAAPLVAQEPSEEFAAQWFPRRARRMREQLANHPAPSTPEGEG